VKLDRGITCFAEDLERGCEGQDHTANVGALGVMLSNGIMASFLPGFRSVWTLTRTVSMLGPETRLGAECWLCDCGNLSLSVVLVLPLPSSQLWSQREKQTELNISSPTPTPAFDKHFYVVG
jgi:hypothetical protein